MKTLNTVPMLDLSTGHLSRRTVTWLEDGARVGALGIMEREEGFFISSHHAAEFEKNTEAFSNFPLDLMHTLRFAHANDVQYVLFDRDAEMQAGLPTYDGDDIEEDTFIGKDTLMVGVYGARVVDPLKVSLQDLKIERTWTETLEDGDYEAPEGAWIGIGDASVRITTAENGDIKIKAYPRGDEMADSIGEIYLDAEDLRSTKDDAPSV